MFELDTVKVRSLMFEKNFTTIELVKFANISKQTAAKVIHDGTKVSIKILRKLANAFQVDGNTLILRK